VCVCVCVCVCVSLVIHSESVHAVQSSTLVDHLQAYLGGSVKCRSECLYSFVQMALFACNVANRVVDWSAGTTQTSATIHPLPSRSLSLSRRCYCHIISTHTGSARPLAPKCARQRGTNKQSRMCCMIWLVSWHAALVLEAQAHAYIKEEESINPRHGNSSQRSFGLEHCTPHRYACTAVRNCSTPSGHDA
jgi:hypothetical protein